MKPIIFTDVDGVLNGNPYDHSTQRIDPHCVMLLSHLAEECDAHIIVTSSWRYLIYNESMTPAGFNYMFRTLGLKSDRIAGVTIRDEICAVCNYDGEMVQGSDLCPQCQKPNDRAAQIARWIRQNGLPPAYVAIDDQDLGFTRLALPAVFTNGNIGITIHDILKAKAVLSGANQ